MKGNEGVWGEREGKGMSSRFNRRMTCLTSPGLGNLRGTEGEGVRGCRLGTRVSTSSRVSSSSLQAMTMSGAMGGSHAARGVAHLSHTP